MAKYDKIQLELMAEAIGSGESVLRILDNQEPLFYGGAMLNNCIGILANVTSTILNHIVVINELDVFDEVGILFLEINHYNVAINQEKKDITKQDALNVINAFNKAKKMFLSEEY